MYNLKTHITLTSKLQEAHNNKYFFMMYLTSYVVILWALKVFPKEGATQKGLENIKKDKHTYISFFQH